MKPNRRASQRGSPELSGVNDFERLVDYSRHVVFHSPKLLPSDVIDQLSDEELKYYEQHQIHTLRDFDGGLLSCSDDPKALLSQCAEEGIIVCRLH